jgi:hypothetical protein
VSIPVILQALLLAATTVPVSAGPNDAGSLAQKARALLGVRCFGCHSAQEGKKKGGLTLDSQAAALKGGTTGPALVPGQPDASLLVAAVRRSNADLEMPPDEPLPAGEIELLVRWVGAGAPFVDGPEAAAPAHAAARREKVITDKDRAWWSFEPVRDPPVPGPHKGNPIDAFVRVALAAQGLTAAPPADRRTLIRRVTFDLHGLPATAEQVEAFVADRRPDAFERLVDRLLASPRYGERWARQWLDVVRYAESDGYRQDAFRPDTWPYRDYVVAAFNDDKPYDRFVTEQLAGDEIAPDDPAVFVATGFLRLGMYEWNQRDMRRQRAEILNELTDVTGDVFLGLGVGCARCHDHKFDPILRRDYYRLQAFFEPLLWRDDRFLATPEQQRAFASATADWEGRTAATRTAIAALEKPFVAKADHVAVDHFPLEVQELLLRPEGPRTPLEKQIFGLAFRQIATEREHIDGQIKGPARVRWSDLRRRLDEAGPRPQPPARAFIATDVGPEAPATFVPDDPDKTPVLPGFLSVLDPRPAVVPPAERSHETTGRRTALAKWLVSPDNPLAARVMVNRIWQRHFGRGLTATSGDFGHLGERPSHPELLDWLTSRFRDGGLRVKALDRMIVTSAAYRQASANPKLAARAIRIDPDNRLLWRQNLRRLDAEQVRDALLSSSGELDVTMAGPSVEPTSRRRSIYTRVLRNTRDGLLAAFDAADGLGSTPVRNVTTTAPQALLLLNSRASLDRARALAIRVRTADGDRTSDDVKRAWRFALGRAPGSDERARARAFLRSSVASAAGAIAAEAPTQPMPHRGGKALRVRGDHPGDAVSLPAPITLPGAGFTVEAVVALDSAPQGGALRTIVALDPTPGGRGVGFSLAVAARPGEDSAGTLVLRLHGRDEQITSDLRLDLHKTTYVAASITSSGVTFQVRDLTDPDAALRTATIGRVVTADAPFSGTLVVGAAGAVARDGWDGLVDELRLVPTLAAGQSLLDDGGRSPAATLAHYRFETEPGVFREEAARLPDLRAVPRGTDATNGKASAPPPALVDLCHTLLTSNEFLYVD